MSYVDEAEQKVIAAGREGLWSQAANDPQAADVFADWWEEQGNKDAATSWREHAAGLRLRYGRRRNYPKIHLFADGVYVYSTTWSKTLKDAKRHFWDNPSHSRYAGHKITARFAEPKKYKRRRLY